MSRSPEQQVLAADTRSGPYLIGVADGLWGPECPDVDAEWPHVVFWLAAAPRSGAPDRYYIRSDFSGYPAQSPTGAFWDPIAAQPLQAAARPNGTGRVAMVFRINWNDGRAFYHPYDRVALATHADWVEKHKHLRWHRHRTITDYLEAFSGLLRSPEYTGVRGG